MKKILFFFMLLPTMIWAQRNCGSFDHHVYMMGTDPNYVQRQQEIEQQTEEFVAHYNNNEDRALVTIPVVVHVIYNSTTSNISDAQILSQITVLNQDFRKTNPDASLTPSIFTAADPNIEFCLATVDPSGNATTGITRTSSTVASFSTNDAMKYTSSGGKDAWDRSKYLNLWVCTLSGGILGYAQFPGGTAATDGVVIDYRYFGTTGTATAPFNKGRTATHEVGHWLNLRHIWGDANCGSDLVTDTPTHNTANYGCPAYPHNSTCTGTPVEMTMNYMDYTDDACMYMFSAGQVTRMQALFATGGTRASLMTSNGCGTPAPVTCGVPGSLAASSITTTGATLSWAAVSGATSYNVQYKLSTATTWTTTTSTTTSKALTGLTAGSIYNYQVQAVCSAGAGAYSSASSFTTTATTTTCTDSYESNNSLSSAKTMVKNANITAKISSATDYDYFKFTTTSTDRNIKIDLTGLPADYDLKLYNSSNTQVGASANSGTTSESIIYNNGAAGTYKVYVYGYNGAFNNTSCYTLRANTSGTAFRLSENPETTLEESLVVENTISIQNVFPNPTQGKLEVKYYQVEEEMIQVEMFDLTGKKVLHQTWSGTVGNNGFTVDMQDFSAGHYVLVVRGGSSTDSIIVQKD